MGFELKRLVEGLSEMEHKEQMVSQALCPKNKILAGKYHERKY